MALNFEASARPRLWRDGRYPHDIRAARRCRGLKADVVGLPSRHRYLAVLSGRSMAAGEYLSAKAEMELHGAAADEPGPLEKGLAMFVASPLSARCRSSDASRARPCRVRRSPSPRTLASRLGCDHRRHAFRARRLQEPLRRGHLVAGWVRVAGIGGAACVAFFTARVVERLLGDGGG